MFLPCRCTLPVFCLLLLLCPSLLAQSSPEASSEADPATQQAQTPVQVANANVTYKPDDTDLPEASPARPTVTFPAHIPPVGYLQFEQGFNEAGASPGGTAGQFAYAQTLKISLTTRLMVQAISQPWALSRYASTVATPTFTSNDAGDLDLGAQAILHKQRGIGPTIAIAYQHRIHTGSTADLDVGSYNQSAILLLSGDLGSFHYDSNVVTTEQISTSTTQANSAGQVRRPQFAQSFAVSHVLFSKATHDRLGGVAELSHSTQPFVHTTSGNGAFVDRSNAVNLLLAGVYSLRPNLILDIAYGHGLTSTSTENQGSFGFTYLLPHRLWPDRHPVPNYPGHPPLYRLSR